jgi:hypothetical protein
MAASTLRLPIPRCDLPMLYQRWVGFELVRTLRKQGWTIATDPLGPLWLGGSIRAIRAGTELRLDVEQRYVSRSTGNGGIDCVMGESLTPDFTLRFASPWGQAAWILDATLSQDPALAVEKQQKYHAGLRMSQPWLVAGVPTFVRPSRSWVAAPLLGRPPHLSDTDGTTGTVSVDPSSLEQKGLEAWLNDLHWWVRGTKTD